MKRVALWAILCAAVISSCKSGPSKPKVRVTLNDGQVLVGELTTRTFTLKTDMGTLRFDTSDAGELGPLTGSDMKKSERTVKLWLRNGSEFVGSWEKAAVTVALDMGGKDISVEVPIEKVERLQFEGEAEWSDDPMFRVLTKTGDDFFVDLTKTQIVFSNELGRFDPFLKEIENLKPLDTEKKKWEVRLEAGTVFNAEIAQDALELRLDMGPESFKVPLASIERMERQTIKRRGRDSGTVSARRVGRSRAPGAAQDHFYTNASQKVAKEEAAKEWREK
ncbi:MAG: hypothetical protein ACYTFG_09905 [Planctomycetota bacterium]|jgi:hypothetical protein